MKIILAYNDLGKMNRILEQWFRDRFNDKSPENESFIKYAKGIEIVKDGKDQ